MILLPRKALLPDKRILVAGDAGNGDTAIDPSTKIAMHGHIAAHVKRR